MNAKWRDYACPSSNTVEVVRPFECRKHRVTRYYFSTSPCLLDEIQKARQSPDDAYRNGIGRPVNLALPSAIYPLSWKGGSILADGLKVEGITKFIKHHLYPVHQVRSYAHHAGKLSARKARILGKKVDKELKSFAKDGVTTLSKEGHCVVSHLYDRDISLFDSGVLVSNKGFIEGKKEQLEKILCNKKVYSDSYAGTEIDLVGFDHLKREIVVIELKITTDRIDNLIKRYHKAKVDRSSGFSRSTIGCYLAQTACSAAMFHQVYALPKPPKALLVICESGGRSCRSFEIAHTSMDRGHFKGWIPGFS
jgi:hypothetical protein